MLIPILVALISAPPSPSFFQNSVNRQPLAITSFNELRVATPYALGDFVHGYGLNPFEEDTYTDSGGTITEVTAQSALRLTVDHTNTSHAAIRTNTYFQYQAGRAMNVRLTLYHSNSGNTNQVRQWGLFTNNDGLFFQLSGTTLSVCRRTSTSGSPVDTCAAQSTWNRDIPTIDVTKGNIYEISYQWLGVGAVTYYINGVPVHYVQHANTLSTPYMKTGTLPITIRIYNSGVSTAASLTYICGSVFTDAGSHPPDRTFVAYNPSDITVTTERPVLSIKVGTTFTSTLSATSLDNRITVLPTRLILTAEANRAGWRLVMNPSSMTGSSFSAINKTGILQDTSATAIVGGVTLTRGMVPAPTNGSDMVQVDLTRIFSQLGRKLQLQGFTGTSTLTVMMVNEGSGGGPAVRAAIEFEEYR